MKVHIVLYKESNPWILTKIATRLKDSLSLIGHQVTMSSDIDPQADVNHHIVYLQYKPTDKGVHSLMITHIDNSSKLSKIKKDLMTAKVGICMSKGTMQELVRLGVPKDQLQYAHMASDGVALPRKITLGFTTRLYADGRKREDYFNKLLTVISPEDFKFEIMGFGWASTVERMRQEGFEVRYAEEFDYNEYMQLMSRLDYYMYLGSDEGSAGFIDALAAGVKTIVQPQGFHLDAPNGITHSFTSFNELRDIFLELTRQRKILTGAVESWTWDNYAKKHVAIWEASIKGNLESVEPEVYANLKPQGANVFITKMSLFFNLILHKATLVWNLRKRGSFPAGPRFFGPKRNDK
uniref:hypothetical protein n=1 Tax=Pedobacter schmidteae TaxID=2201271 RepID=UPI000EAFDD38|nr:hypothetical protein [Pedobacter schmidteae]